MKMGVDGVLEKGGLEEVSPTHLRMVYQANTYWPHGLNGLRCKLRNNDYDAFRMVCQLTSL